MKTSKIIAVIIAIIVGLWIASGFFSPQSEEFEVNAGMLAFFMDGSEEMGEEHKNLPNIRVRATLIQNEPIKMTELTVLSEDSDLAGKTLKVTDSVLNDLMEGINNKGEKEEKPTPKVRIRDITAEEFADTVVLTGRSQASRSVEIKAEISGAVLKILKEEGETIAQDDLMAELDVRDREARKIEARQRVNQRQIEYNAAKKLADKGFNSKVRLAQSLADLEDAKARLKEASLDLGRVNVTAPFDGVIFNQHIDLGDYVDSGSTLFTLVDLDPIEFVGYVSERRVRELKLGMEADIQLLDGQKIQGTVSYIAPAADAQTRTFRIIVSSDNADNTIKEGLTAKIAIPVSSKKAHKISPSILSLNDDGIIGVKTVNDDNIVEFKPVKILSDKPDAMWITGPADTDRFITVGQEFVIEGQKVEPVASKAEGSLL